MTMKRFLFSWDGPGLYRLLPVFLIQVSGGRSIPVTINSRLLNGPLGVDSSPVWVEWWNGGLVGLKQGIFVRHGILFLTQTR